MEMVVLLHRSRTLDVSPRHTNKHTHSHTHTQTHGR